MKSALLGSMLLLSSALVAPQALAQDPSAEDEDALQQKPEIDISGPVGGLEEITVRGKFIPDTIRANPVAISVLSQEQIERTGDGDIAGALQRVTGLSLVGGRFVYVRGLGERYSQALLNGLPLPSPEPLRRVVPLDLFPTSIIASSVVQKTYSPSFPGEFGGGAINLTTRTVPDEPFLKISAGIGGNTETTGELGYTYFGSDTDWTGFDSGARDVPGALQRAFDTGLPIDNVSFTLPELQEITAAMQNASVNLIQRNENIPVNGSLTISGARAFDFDELRLGVFASFSYSNDWQTRGGIQQVSGNPITNTEGTDILEPVSDFDYLTTQNNIVLNGILGFTAEWDEHVIRFTNIYIRDTLKEAQIRRGFIQSVGDRVEGSLQDQVMESSTAWYERQLIDTQLVGEFEFDDLELNVRGTFAEATRDAPYETANSYVFSTSANDFVNRLRGAAGQTAGLAFSELTDTVWSGAFDLAYNFDTDLPLKVSAGASYYDNDRDSIRREFQYIPNGDALPFEVTQQRIDFLVSDFNVYNYDVVLNETTQAVNQGAPLYEAELSVMSAYVQLEAEVVEAVSLTTGVRYEDAEQTVVPLALFDSDQAIIDAGGIIPTVNEADYFLPALTVTWNFYDDMQLRVGASKTIARPQFRELAPQFYNDPDLDRTFRGNQFLIDSELLNFDVRYEWFFGPEERFTAGIFYKEIDNPIEQVAAQSGESVVVRFANAPSATLYGAEIEFEKFFDLYDLVSDKSFLSERRIYLNANYTFTDSELSVSADDQVTSLSDPTGQATVSATNLFRDGARLTGQSKHLANLQIGLEHPDYLSQQTLIFNYASERVSVRGPSLQPDIIERPGFIVDFVARQGIEWGNTMLEVKLEARNLLNEDFKEFQELNGSEILFNNFERGRTFAITVGAEF